MRKRRTRSPLWLGVGLLLTGLFLGMGGAAPVGREHPKEVPAVEAPSDTGGGDDENTVTDVVGGEGASAEDAFTGSVPAEDSDEGGTLTDGIAGSALQVHFIDVGQGDCTLILCGDQAMLIDAGDNYKGTTVQLYLTKLGISSLDYVIGTHPDADHIGGLDVVLTKFDCGMVILPEVSKDTKSYQEVLDAMEYRGYQNTPPVVGNTYALGDAVFTIVSPADAEYEEINNYSIGVRLIHGENSFLFVGDAEAEAEADMLASGLELSADVLKVSHHGSSAATTEEFLSAVSPRYAVISCGVDNDYGHPHEKVLRRLQNAGVMVFRTDQQGSITAFSDGVEITFNCEP